MATLILAAAGQALGNMAGIGAIGGILGRAAGAVAGSLIDNSLFGSSRTVESGRLADLSVQSSVEGASLPLIYGRVRLAGQVIWATRFEEEVSEETSGGKAGGGSRTTVRSYSYYGNLAVALCEGPVVRIGRVWADGKLLDLSGINHRIYTGTRTQGPDPLITAVQGVAPAYRGTAYVVFERLPLESFGNRLPQLSFEVVRVVERLEPMVKAVTLIPGAGEFVYAPTKVTDEPSTGTTVVVNRHTSIAASDWHAALDELQALCPTLESVALVVAWFGDDLRAGQCSIRPKVETASRNTSGMTWQVGPVTRAGAQLVSQIDGRPAFGGTPCDASVIAAIRDLKARGLRVVLYPFILMDIPAGNSLPAPEGGASQPVYPWRGRIVPSGSVAADVAAFMGSAMPAHFSVSGEAIGFSGNAEDWGYRRFILHLAHLAEAAGGVDAFLTGSEMRGLTRASAGGGIYPFVMALRALTADVRGVLRAGTKISYAADWSEYGAHQPEEGEVRFPLDPFWADPAVDFVGIDNYLPLTDLKGEDGEAPYDLEALRAGVAGGEYFDWYYRSDAERRAGQRTPITDGAYGKPFVYRAKDIRGWWENPHVERVGGVELAAATAWVPMSKPIWFTELGIPAIDRGANQPNVFVDPKSSESTPPHFSSGTRDDAMQRMGLEAVLSYWGGNHPELARGDNPVSPVYGGRMVDEANLHLWTYDARPFPAFPVYGDVWSDGGNWEVGHWLNGRLGSVSIAGLIRQMLEDFGIDGEACDVLGPAAVIEGMTLAGPVSLRDAIEPLLEAFGGQALDLGDRLRFAIAGTGRVYALDGHLLAEEAEDQPLLSRVRAQNAELTSEIRLSGEDPQQDFRRQVVASRRLEGGSRTVTSQDLAVTANPVVLMQAADARLQRVWAERERVEFSLPPTEARFEVGDLVEIAETPDQVFSPALRLRIERIETAQTRKIEAVRSAPVLAVSRTPQSRASVWQDTEAGPPHVVMMNLPLLQDADGAFSPVVAAFARPWPGELAVLRSRAGDSFEEVERLERPATTGTLTADLPPGPVWRWDEASVCEVEIHGGLMQSRSAEAVLSGANALAVLSRTGGYELLQFRNAELTGPRRYRLTGLLRGQKGSEAEAAAGAEAGAVIVLLDGTHGVLPLEADLLGRSLTYRILPAGAALDTAARRDVVFAASGRAALPLAPVHLRASRESGGIRLSWIRRTRKGGDSWDLAEVPLGETADVYRVDILSAPGGSVLRSLTSTATSLVYPAADEAADFGGPVASLAVRVCQISPEAGPGAFLKEVLNV
ncbi:MULTISPECIES: glycoside hydrolase/phage tail family protein [unclassified Pannonibacter]|uniref:baseplate multidomain protein megatron n=1 Tax=unclassified Pannonibacter TaxID=2627228 RepID=UPI0016467895|nr:MULTISPECIES: glycoside hydrolase/phage tail family protein [unclassified Pannonibacter]